MWSAAGRKWIILMACALAVVTCVTFAPSVKGELLTWDDYKLVKYNKIIKELSIENLRQMFTSFEYEAQLIPLVWLSYAIEIALFGEEPAVFHIVNILLHLANVFLVLLLLYRLTGNPIAALIAAALFAVHPMHVESVAWISERKDVLSTMFFLFALICYTSYLGGKGLFYYGLSLGAFILACLSKPMVITIPVLLVLIDYFKDAKILSWRSLLEKIPFF